MLYAIGAFTYLNEGWNGWVYGDSNVDSGTKGGNNPEGHTLKGLKGTPTVRVPFGTRNGESGAFSVSLYGHYSKLSPLNKVAEKVSANGEYCFG